MAKQRKVVKNGRTRWRVSWYDAVGQRRQRFFKLKGDADRQLSAAIAAEDQRCAPMIDPSATVRAYAAYWLPVHATTRNLKARTVEGYEDTLALHVLDFQLAGSTKPIGDFRMARLTRLIGKRLIAAHRQQGNLGERSVGNIHAIVSAMCNGAVADGLLPANPMAGLRKELRLAPSVQA